MTIEYPLYLIARDGTHTVIPTPAAAAQFHHSRVIGDFHRKRKFMWGNVIYDVSNDLIIRDALGHIVKASDLPRPTRTNPSGEAERKRYYAAINLRIAVPGTGHNTYRRYWRLRRFNCNNRPKTLRQTESDREQLHAAGIPSEDILRGAARNARGLWEDAPIRHLEANWKKQRRTQWKVA